MCSPSSKYTLFCSCDVLISFCKKKILIKVKFKKIKLSEIECQRNFSADLEVKR